MTALATTHHAALSVAQTPSEEQRRIMEQFILTGNFDNVPAEQQPYVYIAFCNYINVDPMERPFDLIKDQTGTKLYANSACAAALCRTRKISCEVIKDEIKNIGGIDFAINTTKATVTEPDGSTRSMTGTGVLPLSETEMVWNEKARRKIPTGNVLALSPEKIATRLMHAETKAMRRAVLRTVGLGHVRDVTDAPADSVRVQVDARDGEIIVQQDAASLDQTQGLESAQELLAKLASLRNADPDTIWGHVCKSLGVPAKTSMSALAETKLTEAIELLRRWFEKAASEQRSDEE